jgi:predicted aconitase
MNSHVLQIVYFGSIGLVLDGKGEISRSSDESHGQSKKIMDDVFGTGPQSAMRLLVTLGEIYGAERMIPVSSCHVGGRGYLTSGEENIKWMTDLLRGGARFQVFTSTNPC